jgi:hypothetical protein
VRREPIGHTVRARPEVPMTAIEPPGYPATLDYDPPESIANWRPLAQWVLAIPQLIIVSLLNTAGQAVAFISWLAILFTGRLPESLANFQAMHLRYSVRVTAYAAFLYEEYPPFTFDMTGPDPGDAAHLRIDFTPQLEDRNRLSVFFRLILAIPHLVIVALLSVAGIVCLVVAFFAVLFTGRWPAGLRDFVVGIGRWTTRLNAYLYLLTDEYPPFMLE